MSESYCPRHSESGGGYRSNRAPLEAVMRCLPKNQAGAGAHKCAYCAYERGIEEGRRREQQRIADQVLDLLKLRPRD